MVISIKHYDGFYLPDFHQNNYIIYCNYIGILQYMLPHLQYIIFFILYVIPILKKVFFFCLSISSIVVYYITIILKTLNKVVYCIKFRVIKHWLIYHRIDRLVMIKNFFCHFQTWITRAKLGVMITYHCFFEL